jgi:type IV pilus assembly protein PilE
LNKQKAFTLIELMVTVAIVGILASIAYPSYQDSVMKSRRVDAQGALLAYANTMERHFTVNNKYTDAPTSPGTAYYDITVSAEPAVTASTYTLNAAPKGVQVNDKCGTLTLKHTGVKGFTGTGGSTALCW